MPRKGLPCLSTSARAEGEENEPRQVLHRGRVGRPGRDRHARGDLAGDRGGHRQASPRRPPPTSTAPSPPPARRSTTGPWPQMTPAERADVMAALSADPAGPLRGDRHDHHRGDGLADLVLGDGPGLRRHHGARLLHRAGPRVRVRGAPPGMLGPTLVRREPVGVVGAIVPWNVPLFVTMLKLGPALAVGLDRGAEAGAGDAARRVPPRRGRCRRPGCPRACVNIVPAGREVGEHLVTPSRRRQDLLHRQHRRRPQDRRASAASS